MTTYCVNVSGVHRWIIDVEADNEIEAKGKAIAAWELGKEPGHFYPGDFEPDWEDADVDEVKIMPPAA